MADLLRKVPITSAATDLGAPGALGDGTDRAEPLSRWTVQNRGSATVFVGAGDTAAESANRFTIAPGAHCRIAFPPTGATVKVWARTSSASARATLFAMPHPSLIELVP